MENEKKLLQVEDEKENTKVSAPAESFNGLPMHELISAPLIAISEAQQQLATSTLIQALDGIGKQKVPVKAPFLELDPVPAWVFDNENINFRMEVPDESTSENAENADLSTDVTSKSFRVNVSVKEKDGTSGENTRSTNHTAKYQVTVSASKQSQAEELSKLMDIMERCEDPSDTKE